MKYKQLIFRRKTSLLIIALALPQIAGLIGALFTSPAISTWYMDLIKPSFNPPNWIFGPVWTSLYLLMGIAFYLILTKGVENKKAIFSSKRNKAIYIFLFQLILNSLWSIIFFGIKNTGLAFAELVILWAAILLTIVSFYKISKTAAYLLLPYILWVSFAGALNYFLWTLN